MSAPDIIPEREKLRSSPEAGSYTVTVEKTENHCPTSESTTIVTHEEIIHDGGSTVETKVHKTTERVVSTKTVETVIVNTEEVRVAITFLHACLWTIQKGRTLKFIDFWTPCTLLNIFKVPHPPERICFQVITPPPA